jgi:hypothetical protein
MNITYLASPYSHRDPDVMAARYRAVVREAARMMRQGEVVYCPIGHSHEIGLEMPAGMNKDHDFWMKQCIPLLAHSSKLVVYCIPGWEESRGVTEEIHLANRLGIPVKYQPCTEQDYCELSGDKEHSL